MVQNWNDTCEIKFAIDKYEYKLAHLSEKKKVYQKDRGESKLIKDLV